MVEYVTAKKVCGENKYGSFEHLFLGVGEEGRGGGKEVCLHLSSRPFHAALPVESESFHEPVFYCCAWT